MSPLRGFRKDEQLDLEPAAQQVQAKPVKPQRGDRQ
jgi:hypothetical protein